MADEDDAALREAVALAESQKPRTLYDRAKRSTGSSRSLLIVQWYAREHALQHIVWQRPERRAICRHWSRELVGSICH